MPPGYEPVETWERRPGAATAPLGGYRRREPEKTLLHQVVRERLERLCRYAVRPPFALHRLSQGPDGRLPYKMKRPRSGSLFLLLTPDQLLARIATLVPPLGEGGEQAQADRAGPAEHLTPVPPLSRAPPPVPTPWADFTLAPPAKPPVPDRLGPRYRVPWAELLRKVFSLDVLACPRCGGRMELIAFIAEAGIAKRILDHIGLPPTGPPVPKPPGPDEAPDPGPEYDGADSTHDD